MNKMTTMMGVLVATAAVSLAYAQTTRDNRGNSRRGTTTMTLDGGMGGTGTGMYDGGMMGTGGGIGTRSGTGGGLGTGTGGTRMGTGGGPGTGTTGSGTVAPTDRDAMRQRGTTTTDDRGTGARPDPSTTVPPRP